MSNVQGHALLNQSASKRVKLRRVELRLNAAVILLCGWIGVTSENRSSAASFHPAHTTRVLSSEPACKFPHMGGLMGLLGPAWQGRRFKTRALPTRCAPVNFSLIIPLFAAFASLFCKPDCCRILELNSHALESDSESRKMQPGSWTA